MTGGQLITSARRAAGLERLGCTQPKRTGLVALAIVALAATRWIERI